MLNVPIPYNWEPRAYQYPLWNALKKEGIQRAVYVWHRRAGKDLFGLHYLMSEAVNRVGTYWHVFPTFKQGRRAIWEESTLDGKKYIDVLPKELIKNINNQEMSIRLFNDSVYKIVGSDDYDSLRGAGIKGAIFSEYAEQNPKAWVTIQPMIEAAKGWAIFNFTPKGKNHAYDMFRLAEDRPNWFSQILTNNDTQVFDVEQIDRIKEEMLAAGEDEDFFNQEYFCSFDGQVTGAYYGKLMTKAYEEGRVTSISNESDVLTHTAWDLGFNDATSIWFFQVIGNQIRFIDYYENSGESLEHYIKVLKEKGYTYGTHIGPHDIAVTEYSTGVSRIETAYKLGVKFDICPNIPVIDGIYAARQILNRCWFDKDKCRQGIAALQNYKKDYDEKRQCFKEKPLHDWSSHCADAFRYFAVGFQMIDNFGNVMLNRRKSHRPRYAIDNT